MNADVLTTRVADGIAVITLGSARRMYFDAEMGDVRSDGSVLNQQEVLQDLRNTGLTFHSIDLLQSLVRIYGSTALVIGESRTVTSRHGLENRAHFRFIAIYARDGESIRLVHFQSTTLAR